MAITRGIRQGCPLSPLLYAAVSDLYLRRLSRSFPDATLRAWADDLAMVLPGAMAKLSALHQFFDEFFRLSGLRLNVPKTVVVPLDPFDELSFRQELLRRIPE